ncbi:MAG TPA: helix-turn-helix transcriptional regulator [Candidatus Fimenecus stercoravium]|nr:helix-turn-helix transcriptional regulator [Candidatus Fimenecus stercoravium]
MEQTKIGNFIAQKRKEKNLTQSQLAAKLGVSDKTVSKWERGKCMPDYSIAEALCAALGITLAELFAGEAKDTESPRTSDEQQMLDMLERIRRLEKQKQVLQAALLVLLGMALLAVSHTVGGTSVQDFLSGALLGVGVGTMLVGVVLTVIRALGK